MLRFDTDETRSFWQLACAANGIAPATTHHAGTFAEPRSDERVAFINELSVMASDARKRGTAHLRLQFEREEIPMRRPGDCWIVTTTAGKPLCVVRITNVAITPCKDVEPKFAASEGEGDLSVAHWRGAHLPYFKSQCQQWGEEWREDRLVVCENFELVYTP